MTYTKVVDWAGAFQESVTVQNISLGRYDTLPSGFLQRCHFSGQIIKFDEWLDHGAMVVFASGCPPFYH
jgi:hypothetical protein